MEYFRIKNWEKYQHSDCKRYNNGLPWIKLHTDIIIDEKTRQLCTNLRLTWILLLAYSGRTRNKLVHNSKFLMQVLGLKQKPDLAVLLELGLIEPWTASLKQAERRAKIREEKIRVDKKVRQAPLNPPKGSSSAGTKNPKKKNKPVRKVEPEVVELIDFLNLKCNTKFRPTTHAARIKRALGWGFSLEDLKRVVMNKLQDKYFQEHRQYFRPQTLWQSAEKVESYLQENIKTNQLSAQELKKKYSVARASDED